MMHKPVENQASAIHRKITTAEIKGRKYLLSHMELWIDRSATVSEPTAIKNIL